MSNGSTLHGLIWSMARTSLGPRWDLRSHQAHTFERHLFIFKMQMQPTSKAISCGEHTMWMCWSAVPGGVGWGWRGGVEAPLVSGSGSPTPSHTHTPHPVNPPRPHTNIVVWKEKAVATERLSSHQNHVYPFSSFIYKGLMEHIYTRCAGDRAPCARWGQPLREPEETMPDLLPLPSSLQPLLAPSLSSTERLQGLGGGGWEG